jgi:hypothetical protein
MLSHLSIIWAEKTDACGSYGLCLQAVTGTSGFGNGLSHGLDPLSAYPLYDIRWHWLLVFEVCR